MQKIVDLEGYKRVEAERRKGELDRSIASALVGAKCLCGSDVFHVKRCGAMCAECDLVLQWDEVGDILGASY